MLFGPVETSFDGERILVANNAGSSVTVFKAADFSFIGNITAGTSTGPEGACSDGINFWVTPLDTGNCCGSERRAAANRGAITDSRASMRRRLAGV